MSTTPHPRLPLVVTANRRALDQADRMMPGRVLENEVRRALVAGAVAAGAERQATRVFLNDLGLEVVCVRRESAISGRKAYQPVLLRPQTKGTR